MMLICGNLEAIAGLCLHSRICTSQSHLEGGFECRCANEAWDLHSMHMPCSKSLMHCCTTAASGPQLTELETKERL